MRVDGADAGKDVVGDAVGKVGVSGAAVEDDGEVDVVLGKGLFGRSIGEGEGGEGDGEVGVGTVGALLDIEGGERWGVFGGVDAAKEDGAVGGICENVRLRFSMMKESEAYLDHSARGNRRGRQSDPDLSWIE